MQVQIESGIEIPVHRMVIRAEYPYERMAVGDSFLVESNRKTILIMVCKRNSVAGKTLGMKFIAKRVDGGVRVWRVT
jgi:hypothetical protein